jgi:hypothetical protein
LAARSLHAWLTLQLRYLVFHGPVRLVVKGARGVRVERAEHGRIFGQEQLAGFSANLTYSVTRTETFWPYLFGRESLLKDRVVGGDGVLIVERRRRGFAAGGARAAGSRAPIDAMLKTFADLVLNPVFTAAGASVAPSCRRTSADAYRPLARHRRLLAGCATARSRWALAPVAPPVPVMVSFPRSTTPTVARRAEPDAARTRTMRSAAGLREPRISPRRQRRGMLRVRAQRPAYASADAAMRTRRTTVARYNALPSPGKRAVLAQADAA